MEKILARHAAGMSELREPNKLFERANGEPIAILNRNRVVGYYVPAERVNTDVNIASQQEALAILKKRKPTMQPINDYLRNR